jgi:hypothetical protein
VSAQQAGHREDAPPSRHAHEVAASVEPPAVEQSGVAGIEGTAQAAWHVFLAMDAPLGAAYVVLL